MDNRTVRYIAEKTTVVVLCIASLVGLHYGIEYSGWLMFAGFLLII